MRLPLLSSLIFCLLPSCKHDADVQCYSGVVVGQTCMDGVIIQVNERTLIGKPIQGSSNAVAAVNDLGNLHAVGSNVYFTYTENPNNQGPDRFCTQNTSLLPIPHLILNYVSATPCAAP